MIVSVFPTEVESTYYVAPISKKDSITKKSVIARGKLINKWRNRCTLNKKFKTKLKKEENIEREVQEEDGRFIYININNHCFIIFKSITLNLLPYCLLIV